MLSALTAEPAPDEPCSTESLTPSDEARLARALVEHFDFVWRLLVRLGVERERAQDEALRTFQILQGKLAQVAPTRERSFLVGVTTRVAANARRAQQRERELPRGEGIEGFSDTSPSPEELLHRKRERLLLDQILDALSFEQRTVFVLSELEGMSRREIAEHLQLPEGTVSSRYRLAKEHFSRLVKRVHAEWAGAPATRRQS